MKRRDALFRGWLYQTITIQGYHVAAAGLYLADRPDTQALEQSLQNLRIDGQLLETDIVLAKAVADGCRGRFAFAGACLCGSGDSGSTGGVIGDPGVPANSAFGFIERMRYGMLMMTFPGSPGVIFDNEIPHQALMRVICSHTDRTEAGKAAAAYLQRQAPDAPFLIVCDGFGISSGYLAVYDGEKLQCFKEQ